MVDTQVNVAEARTLTTNRERINKRPFHWAASLLAVIDNTIISTYACQSSHHVTVSGRLHDPIVGPTCRSDPTDVRPVGQTVSVPAISDVNQIGVCEVFDVD